MSKKFSFIKKKIFKIAKSLLSIWFDISCIQTCSKCVKNYYCGHIIQLGCYVFNLRRRQEDSLGMKSEQELHVLLRCINQKSKTSENIHTHTHTACPEVNTWKSPTAIGEKTPWWGLTSLQSGCFWKKSGPLAPVRETGTRLYHLRILTVLNHKELWFTSLLAQSPLHYTPVRAIKISSALAASCPTFSPAKMVKHNMTFHRSVVQFFLNF